MHTTTSLYYQTPPANLSGGVGKVVKERIDARLTLSRLELQIALLARAGLKRWEIATVLGIQQGTVKSQLERVTAKLGPTWKERKDVLWPELEPEVHQAVLVLQGPEAGNPMEEAILEAAPTLPALGLRAARSSPVVRTDGGVTPEGITPEGATMDLVEPMDFSSARRALEGELTPGEAAILQLEGLPSPKGRAFLRQARSTQWQLLLLGECRSLYVSAGARFWLKPALAVLSDNRQIRFLQSDNSDEPYRPWWLPYTTSGRARGTNAAYYKLQDAASGEYASSYLRDWIDNDLENYVASLHARMQQRWRALNRIALAAGRGKPRPLPDLPALLAEARRVLGID